MSRFKDDSERHSLFGVAVKETLGRSSIVLALVGCLILVWGDGARGSAEEISFQGNRLSIKWDTVTGAPLTIRGKKVPLLEIGPVSKLSRSRITKIGPLLVKKFAPLLKIHPDDLRLKAADRIAGSWYVSYWQTFKGAIIYESSLGFSIDPEGRVVSLGAILYPRVQVPEGTRIGREKALIAARERVPDFKTFKYRLFADSVIIYPERKADTVVYYRVYAFNFFPRKALHPASAVGGWAVLVDTQTGRPVLVQTLIKPMGCCVPENWTPPKTGDDYQGIWRDKTGKTFLWIGLVFLLLGIGACRGNQESAPRIRVGQKARDFAVRDLKGQTWTLDKVKGQVVLLRFWDDQCHFCRNEMPVIEKVYRRLHPAGFEVLAVNVKQSPQAVEAFTAQMDITFPLGLDPDGKTASRYGVFAVPANFLIDRNGVIQEAIIGGSFREEKILNKFLRKFFPDTLLE